ncbi:hypothetical protein D7B24_002149 [Verticillium nonalfalfae]|uniref:Nucleoside phosphorylase domain-containing protein n=1 Tax=Verticillium nonalfalfae TaxID=1051616 RepID=A0A3M9YKK3_9PEZI|nr:uncharacterized protein D7B24_002149 [Verticillium nonalfalfae]RNJ59540.1 hypothetical protein D7B24_002149 [Verticillium nonalfalfae]
MAPVRPCSRRGFEVAIICALTKEADPVEALFDNYWDEVERPPYDKARGDSNAYTTGSIGRHNVVLAYMPGMGKTSAAAVAANCRISYPNIKLALVVGICGVVPFDPVSNAEIVLGDVIISHGVSQYDVGRRHVSGEAVRKETLTDPLGGPNSDIRTLLARLEGPRGQKILQAGIQNHLRVLQRDPDLSAEYPGAGRDQLYESAYEHIRARESCRDCGCTGNVIPRRRLGQGAHPPAVHYGLLASGDTVMRSGKHRDQFALERGIVGFEMEGAGVWNVLPCVVIKGACDYADSHKTKEWQTYAAATAAACMKEFLCHWDPPSSSQSVA